MSHKRQGSQHKQTVTNSIDCQLVQKPMIVLLYDGAACHP